MIIHVARFPVEERYTQEEILVSSIAMDSRRRGGYRYYIIDIPEYFPIGPAIYMTFNPCCLPLRYRFLKRGLNVICESCCRVYKRQLYIRFVTDKVYQL